MNGNLHCGAFCGAMTRKGTPCRTPPVKGRVRCRMHGGAAGSGAPKGNRNALKHGFHTAEQRAHRRAMYALLRRMREDLAEVED